MTDYTVDHAAWTLCAHCGVRFEPREKIWIGWEGSSEESSVAKAVYHFGCRPESGGSRLAFGHRQTIDASDNPALLGGMRAKNNGRYNGNGREWRTPPELYAKLDAEFHFTLDPCTTADNPLGAPRFFTEADNGLEQSWEGERVFMNPPYGREVGSWTKKAHEEKHRGALIVGLLPASTDLAWWHDDVVGCQAEVRYIRGRVRFLTDGPYRASGSFASVIAVWRPTGGG